MSVRWGHAKSWSGYVWTGTKALVSPAGALGGQLAQLLGYGTVGQWISSGWFSLVTFPIQTPPPVWAVAGGAMGGTLVGQGLEGLYSLWHDPILPMDWLSFEDSYTGIADPEIDAFLSEVGPVIGIPISRGDLLEVGPDTAELIQAAYSFLAEGVRAFVGAAQAAAVRTHGSKTQLESALSANQNDLTRYIKAINGFADALDSRRKIADFLPSLQLSHYEDFLAAVLRGGYTALPASELFLFQKLLSLARVRYPGMDYRTELARWVAEGADENELQAFAQAPNQTLRLAEILRGGVDWFWSRVQLRQTVG